MYPKIEGEVHQWEIGMFEYILLVKIEFRLKFLNLGLILNFLCLLALIHEWLGLENKENSESTQVKIF